MEAQVSFVVTHTQKVLLEVEREDEDEGAVGSKRPPLKKNFTPE